MIVDETGLFPLRARDLLAGLRSSVSARAGKIRHISIRGDSELFREILGESCGRVAASLRLRMTARLTTRRHGLAGNPGLGAIKSLSYMREEVARVRGVASDEPSFPGARLESGNLTECGRWCARPDDLRACFTDDEIECRGPCYLGIDVGEAGEWYGCGRDSGR